MIVLAFDPGETTGWCRVDTTAGTLEGGSFPLWEELHLMQFYLADAIVVERFMLYPWMLKRLRWNKLQTVEVIGAIKYVAGYSEIAGCAPITMQNASVAKRIKLAKKPEGFDRHALDAFRHALAFLKRENLLTEQLKEYIA